MLIDVHSAEIKTATVEVKALVIGGKQVTLSVFRQLIKAPVVGDGNRLLGTVWGHVNYFWGECKPDHLHIVWQKGDELRRACVLNPCEMQNKIYRTAGQLPTSVARREFTEERMRGYRELYQALAASPHLFIAV